MRKPKATNFKQPAGDPLRDAGTWSGERAVVIASGPSIAGADVEIVDQAAERGACRVIAVNDGWASTRSASILYAADAKWWKAWKGCPTFTGRKITQNREGGRECAKEFGLECVHIQPDGETPSFDPKEIGNGWHSGFQAVNIAALMGSREIYLLGFDCQRGITGKRHWFGDHPPGLNVDSPYPLFVAAWATAAPLYEAAGVRIVNCSRRTAITSIPRQRMETVFR